MKTNFRVAVLVLSIANAPTAMAAPVEELVKTCDGCHGAGGVSEWSDMPTIAGIDAFTHADALYVYRDGERACAESKFRQGDTSRAATTMCKIAEPLSDEEIEAVAEYYSELPFVPAQQAFDAELAAAGEVVHNKQCDRCHSDGGANADDEAGILAGQWMGYMKTAFAQYAAGERPQDRKMKEKMDTLSAADVEALLHYYASQQ